MSALAWVPCDAPSWPDMRPRDIDGEPIEPTEPSRACSTLEQRWSACRQPCVHEINHPRRYEAWEQFAMCNPWLMVLEAEHEFTRRDDAGHREPCEGAG